MLMKKLEPLSSCTKFVVYDVDSHIYIHCFENKKEADAFVRTNFLMNDFHLAVLPVDLQAEITYLT